MRNSILTLVVCFLCSAASLSAQVSSYEPDRRTPGARPELVGLFISSHTCGGGRAEGLKEAVEELKVVLARTAQEEGSSFRMVGIGVSWDVDASIDYFRDFGPFDELVVGSNWFNMGAERFLWSDTTTTVIIPQVQVFRHHVGFVTPTRVEFQDYEPLIRVSGAHEIIEWVAEGAPFPSE